METLVLEAAFGGRHVPGRVTVSWAGQQLVSTSRGAVTPSMWMSLLQLGDTSVGRNPTFEGLVVQAYSSSYSGWL